MLLVTRGSERRGAVPRDILGKFRSNLPVLTVRCRGAMQKKSSTSQLF